MGTDRLPGCGLLNIHRESEVSSEQVVDVFLPERKTDVCRSSSECKRVRRAYRNRLYISIWNHTLCFFSLFHDDRHMENDRSWNCVNQNRKRVMQLECSLANKRCI